MAKPTGAIDIGGFGLDCSAATSSAPCYLYVIIPVEFFPAGLFGSASTYGTHRFSLNRRIEVATGVTFNEEWRLSYGTRQLDFEFETSGAVSESWQTEVDGDERTSSQSLRSFGGNSATQRPKYVIGEIKMWCSAATASTKLHAAWIETRNLLPYLSFAERTNTGTAADRIYAPYFPLSAYHVRKLLISSTSVMASRNFDRFCIPTFGTFS